MVNKTLRLVLLGATGFVGSAVLRRAAEKPQENFQITALVRGDKTRLNASKTAETVEVVEGSLQEPPSSLFPREPHVVVHLANKNVDKDGSGFSENEKNAKNLVEKMPSSTLGIIYSSSLSVYGQGPHQGITEDAPLQPKTPLAVSRVNVEHIIGEAMEKENKSALLLRPRFILGKGDRATLPLLAGLCRKNIRVGSGRQKFSIIDVDHYAEIILHLADNIIERNKNNRAPLRSPLNVSYLEPVSFQKMQEAVCRQTGLKNPRLSVPVNQSLYNTLKKLPVSRLKKTITVLELTGYSQYADSSALAHEAGDKGKILLQQDPMAVFNRIVKENITLKPVTKK